MDEIYRSQFRLPYPLYEQLKASADANRRSVNAELVARLEESLLREQTPRIELPDKDGDLHSLSVKEVEAALLQLNSFVRNALEKRKKK
ncbi:Arc family DNA-binding protein [Pseudomonas citronellolis]|uniref:Arc family DNA-binding protein n=1 Tax=Pseudomonas citronellolis TaxID=53408 RepID=UPI0009EE99ED|nr:Arc family DNA-binding protein [Pseudomonas citronellolis]